MLLTIYLVIKKRPTFLGIKALSPLRLKEAIVALGASFIKLAQVLATRSDFFSEEYIAKLRVLHDQLPPMSQREFEIVYGRAFAKEHFKDFSKEPIASASIGQVHTAYLEDGTKVAIKLRRFNIDKRIQADIRIISAFNGIFKPLFSHYTKNSIEAVISEFSKMILNEISLSQELQNLQNFSALYAQSGIKFPTPYPRFCSDDALVMSFEEGFRFDDKSALKEHNIDFKSVINQLVHFYTDQMLVQGYFHADPHPGNLLLNTQGELILLDFGMVKRVPNQTRIAIIELIKAANEQDYELYIDASKRLGTIAYEAPVSELAEFTSKMFDIFANENLSSDSMQALAFKVLESTKELPFKLPSDAIYILRVSAIIEGLGTTYIENFNGIKDILPILEKSIPKALNLETSPIDILSSTLKDTPFILKDFRLSFKRLSEGFISVELTKEQLAWIAKELRSYFRGIMGALVLMLSGFFLLGYGAKEVALVLFSLGVMRLIYKL